jgi:N-dimethylarginine dimethylaminohydrolase
VSVNCESKEGIRKDSRAQTLYEKVGFRVVSVHPDAFVLKDGAMKNAYLMQLKIR